MPASARLCNPLHAARQPLHAYASLCTLQASLCTPMQAPARCVPASARLCQPLHAANQPLHAHASLCMLHASLCTLTGSLCAPWSSSTFNICAVRAPFRVRYPFHRNLYTLAKLYLRAMRAGARTRCLCPGQARKRNTQGTELCLAGQLPCTSPPPRFPWCLSPHTAPSLELAKCAGSANHENQSSVHHEIGPRKRTKVSKTARTTSRGEP